MRFNVLIAYSSSTWMNSLVLQEVNLKKPCERKNFFQGFFSALKYGDDEKQMVLFVKYFSGSTVVLPPVPRGDDYLS